MADREVSIGFIAKTGAFSRDIQAISHQVLSLKARIDNTITAAAKPFKILGAEIAAAGAAGAGSMAVFTKSAIDFETEMRNVNSILRESEGGYSRLKGEILSLAQDVPKTADDLAGAAYDIVSSGFTSATAMNTILAASAKAATAGLTETKTAAGAITVVLNAYNMSAAQSTYVSDLLFKTVDKGRVTFDQMALQMGDFVSLSKSAGITMEESFGIYAKLTVLTGQYAQSATSVVGMVRAFIKPSADMTKQLKQLYGENYKTALNTKGLVQVLRDLGNAVNNDKEAMGKLIPDTEGLRGALSLLGVPVEELNEYMSDFTDKTKLAGSTQRVFDEQMKAVGNQFTLLKSGINAAGIQLAQGFLPVLEVAVGGLQTFVDIFQGLPQPLKTTIGLLIGLGGLIGVLVGTLAAFAAKKLLVALALKAIGKEGTSLTRAMLPNMGAGLTRLGRTSGVVGVILRALGTTISTLGRAIPFFGKYVQNAGDKLVTFGQRATTASTQVGRFRTAMGKAGDGIRSFTGMVGKGGTAFLGFLTAYQIGIGMIEKGPSTKWISDLSIQFQKAGEAIPASLVDKFGADMSGLAENIKKAGMGMSFFGRMTGSASLVSTRYVTAVDEVDKALGALVTGGNAEGARKQFELIEAQLKSQGVSQKAINQAFNDYLEAIGGVDLSTAINQTEALNGQTAELSVHAKAVAAGFQGMTLVQNAISKVKSRMSQVASSTDDATEAAKDAKREYQEWLADAEKRSISLTRSQWRLRDANRKVAEIQKEITRLNKEWGPAHTKRVTEGEKDLTRARWASADATKRVKDIEQALKEMREPPPRTIREAEIALERAYNAEAEAAEKVKYQTEKLEFARLQGTSEEVAQSERELEEALWGQEEAAYGVEDATRLLQDLRNPTATQEYKDMERELESAHMDEQTAVENVQIAQESLDEIRKESPADELRVLEEDLEAALLDVKDAEIDVKDATHDMTYKTKDEATPAVKDFGDKVEEARVKLVDFKNELKQQLTDQNAWLTNLEHIARVGPPGLAAALLKMGQDGFQIVADMKTKTPPEMAEMFRLMNADAITKTDSWAQYVEAGFISGKGRAETVTTQMVENIATELGIGKDQVLVVLKDYLGVAAEAIKPVQDALNSAKETIKWINGTPPPDMTKLTGPSGPAGVISGPGGTVVGFYQPKAEGGITRDPQISSTPILWAEAGPEAYIPLGMDKRSQSTRLLGQVADMFGYRLMHFADGGIYRQPHGGGATMGDVNFNLGGIHVEARVAAGVDMDYAARVIGAKVEEGVKAAFDRLGREMVVKSWRN